MDEFKKIFAVSQTAALDGYTIDKEKIKSIDLMNRAAACFTGKLLDLFRGDEFFYVVAGAGNNGGDGFVCARLLSEKGKKVRVFSLNPGGVRSADCQMSYLEFVRNGGDCVEVERVDDLSFDGEKQGVLVDALLGTGLNRPVGGLLGEVIGRMNACGFPVVALDIPSGLMGEDNSGNNGAVIRAKWTFTFQFPKIAMMLPENYPYVGEWSVLDIGLDPDVLRDTPSRYYWLDGHVLAERLLIPQKFAHKGSQGHVLLVAGSDMMPGAAILAAGAAVRSGAGLVTVHVPKNIKNLLHVAIPEVLVDVDEDKRVFTGCELGAYQAVAVGPGIGRDVLTREGLHRLLKGWSGKLVLDADALNLLAENPEFWKWVPENAVLTPHPKEFERLAGKSENDFDRLNKLSIFARQHGVVIVLKGAHSVIASPVGACYFNVTGNPGMAKGGAGDVLTGVIAGLLASGHSALDAALIGVFAHGLAGDRVARRSSMRGMSVRDIVDELGCIWNVLDNK